MSYRDGRYWITFNGEIYNFIEIKKKLISKGYQFFSETDTEVILAAYDFYNTSLHYEFNGMWSFAIWDEVKKELFISRDRFGVKPFHYTFHNGKFYFASELKAFKSIPDFLFKLDLEVAEEFLRNGFGVEGSDRTLISGIKRLPAGHYGVLKNGRLDVLRYWNTVEHLVLVPKKESEQREEFLSILSDAVKIRTRSDVKIGTCLSGGLDSSVITSLIKHTSQSVTERASKDWQNCFVASFPGNFNDETEKAKLLLSFLGLKGNFLEINNESIFQDMDKILYDFDDVYIGMPNAIWQIYRFLRENDVYVSIDGHGADELMGAYKTAESLYLENAPSLFKHPLKNLSIYLKYRKDYIANIPKGEHFHPLKTFLKATLQFHPNFAGPHRKRIYHTLYQRIIKFLTNCRTYDYNFFKTEYTKKIKRFCENDVLPENWGEINKTLYRMFHESILPTILRNYDRLSMAHGVEVRMPFMDYRLVTYIFSLNDEAKISDGYSKKILRDSVKGLIPEEIRTTKIKIGFNSPMPELFSNYLNSWVENQLDNSISLSELVNIQSVKENFRLLSKRKDWDWGNVSVFWPIIHLAWFEKNFIGKKL